MCICCPRVAFWMIICLILCGALLFKSFWRLPFHCLTTGSQRATEFACGSVPDPHPCVGTFSRLAFCDVACLVRGALFACRVFRRTSLNANESQVRVGDDPRLVLMNQSRCERNFDERQRILANLNESRQFFAELHLNLDDPT